tara:strand:+ start:1344 stop:1859 length:516 start_codon:yes stop_codon:yes gene_type:complete
MNFFEIESSKIKQHKDIEITSWSASGFIEIYTSKDKIAIRINANKENELFRLNFVNLLGRNIFSIINENGELSFLSSEKETNKKIKDYFKKGYYKELFINVPDIILGKPNNILSFELNEDKTYKRVLIKDIDITYISYKPYKGIKLPTKIKIIQGKKVNKLVINIDRWEIN